MAVAFHSSLLTRQLDLLRVRFIQRHPHAWLVWEATAAATDPGRAPPPGPRPLGQRILRPKSGDALCFELAPPPAGAILFLGRNETSDLLVPDATVSRKHLALSHDEGWSIETVSQGGYSFHQGAKMDPDQWYPLAPSDRIKLGDVELTFLSAQQLVDRLQFEADEVTDTSKKASREPQES